MSQINPKEMQCPWLDGISTWHLSTKHIARVWQDHEQSNLRSLSNKNSRVLFLPQLQHRLWYCSTKLLSFLVRFSFLVTAILERLSALQNWIIWFSVKFVNRLQMPITVPLYSLHVLLFVPTPLHTPALWIACQAQFLACECVQTNQMKQNNFPVHFLEGRNSCIADIIELVDHALAKQ